MMSNLEEALYALFGEKAPEKPERPLTEQEQSNATVPQENVDYNTVAKKVVEEFKRAKKANAEGNWNAFGESMTALEQSINQLEGSIKE